MRVWEAALRAYGERDEGAREPPPRPHPPPLAGCEYVSSNDGLRAIASLTSLTHLGLRGFDHSVPDEGVLTLSSLTVLKSLNLTGCRNVSQEAISALLQVLALEEEEDLIAHECTPSCAHK
jgi:hypothetical protein